MRKLLFVDRDGTLVKEPEDYQVDRLDKIKLVEGAIPALLLLQTHGFQIVMVSNQDGLDTDSFPRAQFQPVHEFIVELFASQGVRFVDTLICPHLASDGCACRKPKTGLLINYL
jgi:imidazoleglycerol-phosphate dehydratase / histidinol-phosphatase